MTYNGTLTGYSFFVLLSDNKEAFNESPVNVPFIILLPGVPRPARTAAVSPAFSDWKSRGATVAARVEPGYVNWSCRGAREHVLEEFGLPVSCPFSSNSSWFNHGGRGSMPISPEDHDSMPSPCGRI